MAESRDNINTLDTRVRHIKETKQLVYDVIFTSLNAEVITLISDNQPTLKIYNTRNEYKYR